MNYEYESKFRNAQELIDCLSRGCEVEFEYDGKIFSITQIKDMKILVCEFYNMQSDLICNEAHEVLDYQINGVSLGEIILDADIISRSF